MLNKTTVRKEFLRDMKFFTKMGSKIFLYPFVGRTRQKISGYITISCLIFLTITQLLFTLIVTGFQDLMDISNIAPNIGICVLTVIKYIKIHTHRKVYHKIITHYQDNMWSIIKTNDIKNFKTIIKYRIITDFINKILFYYALPLIIVVISLPLIVMFYERCINNSGFQYLYPFDGWYPFDKVQWFYFIYAWESFMTALVIYTFAFSDMINISCVIYISMELSVLGNLLTDLVTDEDVANIKRCKKDFETHQRIQHSLKIIIKRHQFLKLLSNGLDSALGDVMLLKYVFGSVFICLTAFTFSFIGDIYKKIRYFFFFISLNIVTLNQSMIGQILSDHSVKLANAIYSSNWIYADHSTKTTLLYLMMKTQIPFTLTAKGYVSMDLNTMAQISRTAYQYYNLLRCIYRT
nr:odorant receptor 21 [Achelura yunnanensis]